MADFRMLSAWDNEANEIVVIRRGQAEALRPDCHAGRLVCPIAGCSEPAFTTRRLYINRWGTEVVDGFRHVVAPRDGLHTPESIRHQEGKAQVAVWLRELGLSKVSIERSVNVGHWPESRKARIRRPDVQAVAHDGTKVAFEIQVSPITEALWQQRTSDLTKAGFAVTWLWAWHVQEPVNADTTAMRMQITTGSRPWFLDPQHDDGPRLAATHQVARVGENVFTIRPNDPSQPLLLSWRPLAEHHINEGTIQVGSGDIDQSEEHATAAKRWAEVSPPPAPARPADKGRILPPLDPAELARRDARRAERERRASQRGGAPTRGPLPPTVAELCERVGRADDQIWTTPIEWKSAVAWRLLDRQPGARVKIEAVVAWVEREFPCDKNQAAAPVRAFLRALETQGAVQLSSTHVLVCASAQPDTPNLATLEQAQSHDAESQLPSR